MSKTVETNDVPKEVDARDAKIDALSEQVKALTDAVEKQKPKKPKAPTNRTARVVFLENNPVIEFCEVREVGTALSVRLIIQFEDGHIEPREESYTKAINSLPRHECEIISMKKETVASFQGTVPQTILAKPATTRDGKAFLSDGETPFTPRKVDLEHTKVVATAEIKFINGPWEGKTITVNPDLCLNK